MTSGAYSGFEASIKDADQLFALYEKERLAAAPIVPEEIEVLKRAALILSVTAWETYLEDFLREKFLPLLGAAAQPSDIQSAFNTVAAKWIDNNRGTLQNTLSDWTGDGWKGKIRAYFNEQIAVLNTPNSENCSRLFKVFLRVELKDYWKWRGYNSAQAASRLDAIISVRGKVTHVARKAISSAPAKHIVSRADIESYIRFIKEITLATDRIH
jgi:hypothetical protein